MTETPDPTVLQAPPPMKRSDRAGVVGAMVLLLGVAFAGAIGSRVGAGSDGNGGSVFVTSGDGFNWLLAAVVAGPFVVGAVVCWAVSWVLAELAPERKERSGDP